LAKQREEERINGKRPARPTGGTTETTASTTDATSKQPTRVKEKEKGKHEEAREQ
jgi:hypothetical protein